MEDILKEILYELKEIRKELNKNNPDPLSIKIEIGGEVMAQKVIKEISKQSRLIGKTQIAV